MGMDWTLRIMTIVQVAHKTFNAHELAGPCIGTGRKIDKGMSINRRGSPKKLPRMKDLHSDFLLLPCMGYTCIWLNLTQPHTTWMN